MKGFITFLTLVALSRAALNWSSLFKLYDLNENGMATREEVDQVFDLIDNDGNGKVTMAEYLAVYANATGRSILDSKAFNEQLSEIIISKADIRRLFDLIAGEDELMSPEEFSRATETLILGAIEIVIVTGNGLSRFSSADRNKDNFLTRAELLFARNQMDLNGDRKVDDSEFVEFWGDDFTTNSADNAKRLLGYSDADNDGFFGSIEDSAAFRENFDTNGDRVVGKSEFNQRMIESFSVIYLERGAQSLTGV